MLAIALSLLFGVIAVLALIEIWVSGRQGWRGARSILAELASGADSAVRTNSVRTITPRRGSSMPPVRPLAAA